MENKQLISWKVIGPVGLALMGILALATSCAGGGPVTGGGVPSSSTGGYVVNSITVTGVGEASGSPDVAYVDLGVDVSNSDLGKAIAQANQAMESIMDAMKQMGVADEDMQTTNFNVWPEDRYDPQTGQPTGERIYHVQNTLHVTVRDIAKVGEVLDAGLEAGANNVYGLYFGVDDTSKLEAKARTEAVADARDRAEQLAEALGVKLGDPIIISEGYGSGPILVERVPVEGGGGGGAPPISGGQYTISMGITVTFAIVK